LFPRSRLDNGETKERGENDSGTSTATDWPGGIFADFETGIGDLVRAERFDATSTD
jgi:hypothetical protein